MFMGADYFISIYICLVISNCPVNLMLVTDDFHLVLIKAERTELGRRGTNKGRWGKKKEGKKNTQYWEISTQNTYVECMLFYLFP